MNALLILAKTRAFAIHAVGCVVVGLACWAVVRHVWYPEPLLELMGGGGIFIVLLVADATLGPVLTLVAFNPSKPRHLLLLDYVIIIGVQLAALLYGLQVLHGSRPAFVVFAKDRFTVIRANDLDSVALARARVERFRTVGQRGPEWVALASDLKDAEALKITIGATTGGLDIDHYPQYYRPINDARHDIGKASTPLAMVWGPALPAPIRYLDSSTGGGNADLGVLPMVGRVRDVGMIVDRQSGVVMGYVDADPWPK